MAGDHGNARQGDQGRTARPDSPTSTGRPKATADGASATRLAEKIAAERERLVGHAGRLYRRLGGGGLI